MPRFSASQRRRLLAVARATLINRLVHGMSPADAVFAALTDAHLLGDAGVGQPFDAVLTADGACFVTLWSGKQRTLRGCRGEFAAHQPLPLVRSVAQMTLAAALDDPRFTPLTASDVRQVRIEISVLTPPAPVQISDIKIGKHGLLIVHGSHRGLLLPEVPIEHHLSLDQFLAALCDKAHLPADAWRDPASSLLAFETEAWEEE